MRSLRPPRRLFQATIAAGILALAASVPPAIASPSSRPSVPQQPSVAPGPPAVAVGAFDVRGPRATTLHSPPKPARPDQQQALDALRRDAEGELTVRWSALTGAPSRLERRGRPLTVPAKATPRAVASAFLARYSKLFDLSPEDMSEAHFSREFLSRHNGVTHLTLQQRVEGIDVFGGSIKLNVDAQGRILNVSGEPMPNVRAAINAATPAIDDQAAIFAAAKAVGIEAWDSATSQGLVYFPIAADDVRLAWRVTIDDAGSPDVFESIVDAVDGTLLWRRNLTTYSHIPAWGQVFTSDSPIPNTPMGSSYTATRSIVSFNGGLAFPHGDLHYDWWAGNPRVTTTGNNVDAYLDRDGDNLPDATCASCTGTGGRPDAGVTEDFSFPLDLTLQPDQYQDAAVTNLFYWNNRIHDFFYRLGFDEAAGNFQSDNFGLGGAAGSDPVLAEAQDDRDGTDPGDPPLCNANMSTPADGASPRMQMYLCNRSTPERDGDLEAVVIAHEYSHGVHARIVPLSGRQNPQEGISDYFGLAIVAEAGDPYGGAYGIADYLFNNGGEGIRSSPYSTDASIFPRTYADLNDASSCAVKTCSSDDTETCTKDADCSTPGDTCDAFQCFYDQDCGSPPRAIPQGPCNVSVHHTGELWANPLLTARFNLVEKYGFASGHRTMNQLVVDGMKLSPDNPSMLDGRDAILAADLATNGGAYSCLIWDAFARMGMGVSALTTGNNDLNPLEAFDVPAECSPVMQVNAPTNLGAACLGGFSTETLTIFNTGAGELIVTGVARTAGSTAITVDTPPQTPVFVSPDAHIDFTVRCTPTGGGVETATITVETNDSAQPTLDLVYTCSGGDANIVTTFANSGSFGEVCIGSTKDLDLTIHNSGGCPLSVSAIASDNPQFKVGAVSSLPLVVEPGDTVAVPLRFQPSATPGAKTADLTITSNDPDTPIKHVALTGSAGAATLDMFVANNGSFGKVCAGDLKDLEVTVQNNGACPLVVDDTYFEDGSGNFVLPSGINGTRLEALNSVVFPVRFAPTSFLPLSLRSTDFVIDGGTLGTPPILEDGVFISGTVPPPDINVPATTTIVEFGNVCASEIKEIDVPVCNVGPCNLNVTAAALINGCEDFQIVQNPFPSIVSADFCMSIKVRYTPTSEGPHGCRLRILSDDPNEGTVDVELHATTPLTDIDIPPSLSFLPEVVSAVDVCESRLPFPIANNGLCPINIANVSILLDEAEFAIEAAPSFVTPLQPGQILGDGDLRLVYAPDLPLAREDLGTVHVTYETDAITHATADVERTLCGEAVLTGARVLVTYSGSNVGTVDRIQIQRVVGNRNRRPQLDTVSVVRNVPLTFVDRADEACTDYYFHQEYGGYSNPIQLVPGYYQVTATITVEGRRRTKTVAFSVNACDFNPSVVVAFQ